MGFASARLFAPAAMGLVLLVGCTPREEARAPAAPAPAPVTSPPATLPLPAPPIDRRGLLEAVALVGSAQAAAETYPDAAAGLAGERFALRLPFGCAGPAPEAAARYAYDPDKQALKVTVSPQTWTDADWARTLVGTPQTEAVEGFWVRRPWMLGETCPAGTATAAPAAPETVGLAQVFEKGGSRLLRRGSRPYEVTEKVEAAAAPGKGGFRLVLEGRIASPPDRRPVRCEADQPDARPVCLVMVEFDRVGFEDASGRTLADWRR